MLFDPENPIVKLCAEGMELEGAGKLAEASVLFERAWQQAVTDLEKLSAAHYVARHQKSVADKLTWDETALNLALLIGTDEVKMLYPSLFLNIAKCYEDLGMVECALKNYTSASDYLAFLPDDSYGNTIKAGIRQGIVRLDFTQ